MVQIAWSFEALVAIDAIRDYLRQFNPEAADHLTQRLIDAGNSLVDFPNRGRPTDDGSRELVTVPPYILRYIVRDNVVYITRIKHGRQR